MPNDEPKTDGPVTLTLDLSKLHGFRVGDVVRLNSGGPPMTVFRVPDDWSVPSGVLWCHWFAGDELKAGRFPPAAVRLERSPAGEGTK